MYKQPLVKTNAAPAPDWLGRVHGGTLKKYCLLSPLALCLRNFQLVTKSAFFGIMWYMQLRGRLGYPLQGLTPSWPSSHFVEVKTVKAQVKLPLSQTCLRSACRWLPEAGTSLKTVSTEDWQGGCLLSPAWNWHSEAARQPGPEPNSSLFGPLISPFGFYPG